MFEATTGRPLAIASISTTGIPSRRPLLVGTLGLSMTAIELTKETKVAGEVLDPAPALRAVLQAEGLQRDGVLGVGADDEQAAGAHPILQGGSLARAQLVRPGGGPDQRVERGPQQRLVGQQLRTALHEAGLRGAGATALQQAAEAGRRIAEHRDGRAGPARC